MPKVEADRVLFQARLTTVTIKRIKHLAIDHNLFAWEMAERLILAGIEVLAVRPATGEGGRE